MSFSLNRRRLAAIAIAVPLMAAGVPALSANANADAAAVGKATMVRTLGKFRVGPRAGFRGDVSRGVNGTTGVVKMNVAAPTVINSAVVKVHETGSFNIYRDFNSSDGFALYQDLDGDGLLDPADYAAGPVSQPGYGVSGDGVDAIITVFGDPAKATGATNYLLTVHPAEGSFADRDVTLTIPANGVSTSGGALPASPLVVDELVVDSQAPDAIPRDNYTPVSRIPTANCPTPAPAIGCGGDSYKVFLGTTPKEDGELLAFFNSATDLSDAAMLVVPDDAPPNTTNTHTALYEVAGIPTAQLDATPLPIGNGTGRDAAVAGSRALNNQLSDTVYAVQWDLMGNTATTTLTSDQCASPCPPVTPKGNDVTGPKVTSYTISLANITSASTENAVPARGAITGIDTAVPVNTSQTPLRQLARLQRVKQTSASPPAYDMEFETADSYSAEVAPSTGTVTVDTVLDASDDTNFPEGALVRAFGRLVDATGNIGMAATSNPPALKDTVAPLITAASLIDVNTNNTSDPGEEFRIVFNDPVNPATVGNPDTDLPVTRPGGTCNPNMAVYTDCVTWGQGATKAWSLDNRILTITLGDPTCVAPTDPPCVGPEENRLPKAGDVITASSNVKDPAGNLIANANRQFTIGAPTVVAYDAFTVDTLAPSSVNVFGTGRDGIVDQVDVAFTGNLAEGVLAEKFSVGVPGDTVVAATAVRDGSNHKVVHLTFVPSEGKEALWNTGARPVVTLVAGSGLTTEVGSQTIAPFALQADDKVAPVPLSVTTQDLLKDSHLDHIVIKYSEPIKQGAENPCGYRVPGYTDPAYTPPNAATTPPPTKTCPTTPVGAGRNKPSPVPAGATTSDTVSLELRPIAAFDTDATPVVEFNAANKLPAFTAGADGPNGTAGPDCDPGASLTAESTPNCPILDQQDNALPFFTGLALDRVGPTIVTRETADTNADGKIDQIIVGFGETLSTPSVGAALFTITDPAMTITRIDATSDRVLAIRVVPTDNPKGDSGLTPLLTFLGGTTDVADPGPNASPTDTGIRTVDKAGPAIVAACVAMPTATPAAKLGTCPTGTGNKVAVLMSETLDTAAANVAAADFKVEQPLGTDKPVTAVSLTNGADGKAVVTLTLADNALNYLQDAYVRFSGTSVVTDNSVAHNPNTQTANVIAFGAPTVSLDVTCPEASSPGYCTVTTVNTGATGSPGVTQWRFVDTGTSTVPPAAPTPADFKSSVPATYPESGSLNEGQHNFWLTGKDSFERITDDAHDVITILKPPTIQNVQWVNASPNKPQAWSKTDTFLDGDKIQIGADAIGSDAGNWGSGPVGTGCFAQNVSVDLRSLLANSSKSAVAPDKCDLKTNTETPYRQAQWTGITPTGTTKYPVGTVLKATPNEQGSLVVDGPNGTLMRRPFISTAARRSWQIPDASVILVPPAVINGMAKGSAIAFRDGSFVKGAKTGYYYVSANVKRPVSTAVLAYLKIPTSTVYAASPGELALMPTLGGIGGGGAHPVGVWIRFSNGSIQQVVRNHAGQVVRRAVSSTAALKTLVPTGSVFPANAKDSALPLDSFQRGYRDGTLLRLSANTYGVVSRSSLRRFANGATFTSLGFATSNALTFIGGAMPHVASQTYREGASIDRYKITTVVIKVTNGAGSTKTATVLPGLGGIYAVGTLDAVPVGWDFTRN
ncbi:MAG: hypothetical protein QOE45_367 [Frankiaceae bacterium]|jgi:hypothetical protein|nr:hypothetical protein [Frankiaceae bacterium]